MSWRRPGFLVCSARSFPGRLAVVAGASRGEALKIGVPEDELSLARRSVEKLVADAGISDPSSLDDERLAEAVETLLNQEARVSESRTAVIVVLDEMQDELKRRYKEDPTQALR